MASILLVDDDATTLGMLDGFLTDNDFDVTTATDGVEALKLLNNKSFDLVITDIVMPKADGFDVIMNIVIKPDHPPIIAISGSIGQKDVPRMEDACQMLGVPKLFLKPINMNEMLDFIKSVLN